MVIPATRLKFYRRVRSLAGLVEGVSGGPERLVRAVLLLWQRQSFERLVPTRAPWGTLPYLGRPEVRQFATWLAGQPLNEAAYWLASAYAIWVGDEVREQRALFFTPPALADRVIDLLVSQGACLLTHRWHDPACGGAAFLVPIAQRMSRMMTTTGVPAAVQIQRISRNLSGNDLDPVLLDLSRSFLAMALYALIETTGKLPNFRLLKGDGLLSIDLAAIKPDVLAVNPPYRKLKVAELTRYRSTNADVIEGQPNIYGLFINRALQIVRRGGLIGLLTPTSFLSGQSFTKLRTKLLGNCDALHIDMLSDRTALFMNVEQETAVTVLRTRAPQVAHAATTKVSVLNTDGQFAEVGDYLLPNSGRPWPIPRGTEDATWLQLAEATSFRLQDYGYRARVGHLVGYRDERKRLAKRPEGKRGTHVLPLVWATDISPMGRFKHGRESKYHRKERFVRVRSLQDSGIVTKQVVLLQRLTSSDQKRRLVSTAVPKTFIKQYGGFVCENHVIVLEPTRDDALAPELMSALLNTQCVDRVFRSISGASNVAIFELNELLLPDPTRLTAGKSARSNMDALVRAAYEAGPSPKPDLTVRR